MKRRLCSKLRKKHEEILLPLFPFFCCEKNLAYFCPVWHILKHNLTYFVFVDLATLCESSVVIPNSASESRMRFPSTFCVALTRPLIISKDIII